MQREIPARKRMTYLGLAGLLAIFPLFAAGRGGSANLIDINTATLEQLMTLPGVQEARARAIVKNRPYSNKAQLLSRRIVSAAAYKRIRDLIVARQ